MSYRAATPCFHGSNYSAPHHGAETNHSRGSQGTRYDSLSPPSPRAVDLEKINLTATLIDSESACHFYSEKTFIIYLDFYVNIVLNTLRYLKIGRAPANADRTTIRSTPGSFMNGRGSRYDDARPDGGCSHGRLARRFSPDRRGVVRGRSCRWAATFAWRKSEIARRRIVVVIKSSALRPAGISIVVHAVGARTLRPYLCGTW